MPAVAAAGLRCAQVQLAAEREDGAEHVRVWRLEPGGGANEIADRLRWHVEGWISAEAQGEGEPCGILRLALGYQA